MINPHNKPKSLQDILKQRQQSGFVGREDQVKQFRQNLGLSLEDESRRFLFNVWGQGGVGKSTLLRQFRKIVEDTKIITAYIDEAEKSVPEVMGRLAEELERQGHKLTQFAERYKVYRQKRQELETDPEAPQGFSAFVGKTVVKTGVKLARRVPVGGAVFDFVDEDTLVSQGGEWFSYIAKKLTNKDEVRLVQEPVEVLTPLFLQDIFKIAEKTTISLFFDTYERTGEFLDSWLQEILEGRHGDVPPNILIIIAGRQELDKNLWAHYEGLMVRFPLEAFTEEEAKQYLTRKGITDSRVVDVILRLSGNLPLLVGMLADAHPDDPDQVIEPSSNAVERFLKWIDNPKHRQVALDAAIPRCLNRDVVAKLRGEAEADELFAWLKETSFVNERTDGWAYHDVVKTQMLRYKRLSSPQAWTDLHGKLADYYDTLRNELQLEEEKKQRDLDWQSHTLNVLYHGLCQLPQRSLPVALNEFLAALKNKRTFAEQWAEVMLQAGKDTDSGEVQSWGERLVNGLKAFEEERCEIATEMFTALLKDSRIQEKWQPTALSWRGVTYHLMERYPEALQDFDRAIQLDPNDKLAIALRGETYHLMERYTEALPDFDRAIQLDPNNQWAIARRGETYRRMERYTEALPDFDCAIQLDPNDKRAIANRGVTYHLMERYTEALPDFDRAIELDPKYDWAITLRGETYCLMERYAEALPDFDRAIQLNPNDQWAISRRGGIYRLMERYTEALQDFDRAIQLDPNDKLASAGRGLTHILMERYTEALPNFDRAIELDPNYKWAISRRGFTYFLMERYTEALQDFDRAIQLDANDKLAITRRGETYRRMERYTEALPDFDRAIQLDLNDQWAIARRGLTYLLMERYTEALSDFDRAIQLDPNDDWAIARRGLTYLLMERYTKALSDFDRAIELDPHDDWAIANRGETYLLMERYTEALSDFDRAIQLDPNDQWVIARRGETYLLMERYTEALSDFDRAIQLDPNYQWAIANRGETYRLMERYTEALPDFDRAIQLDPNYQWAIARRGETYLLMERYTEALPDFDRAIQLDPNYQWAIANRGETYLLMERYTEALPDFDRVIELDPNYQWAIARRGETYLMLKQYNIALANFNRAIELDSDSNSDWYLYNRTLVYLALNLLENARTDIEIAIQLANNKYEENSQNWCNTFNLALYCLTAQYTSNAEDLYRYALSQGASSESVRAAIQDLKDFLTIFPDNVQAQSMRQLLQSALTTT